MIIESDDQINGKHYGVESHLATVIYPGVHLITHNVSTGIARCRQSQQ